MRPTDRLMLQQVCVWLKCFLLTSVVKCLFLFSTTRREFLYKIGRLGLDNTDAQSSIRKTVTIYDTRKKW